MMQCSSKITKQPNTVGKKSSENSQTQYNSHFTMDMTYVDRILLKQFNAFVMNNNGEIPSIK